MAIPAGRTSESFTTPIPASQKGGKRTETKIKLTSNGMKSKSLGSESQDKLLSFQNFLNFIHVTFAIYVPNIFARCYLVTGRRVTERRDADAIFSPISGTSISFTRESPSLPCHQIAIGLAIAIVE